MLKHLLAVGNLSAKGGRVTITADAGGYALRYESSEVSSFLVRAWASGDEAAMLIYLLALADESRWKMPDKHHSTVSTSIPCETLIFMRLNSCLMI